MLQHQQLEHPPDIPGSSPGQRHFTPNVQRQRRRRPPRGTCGAHRSSPRLRLQRPKPHSSLGQFRHRLRLAYEFPTRPQRQFLILISSEHCKFRKRKRLVRTSDLPFNISFSCSPSHFPSARVSLQKNKPCTACPQASHSSPAGGLHLVVRSETVREGFFRSRK